MISITTPLIFSLLGLFWLIKLSITDVKHSEIENNAILPLLIFGLAFSLISRNLFITGFLMLFIGLLGFYLWKKQALGGADVKILPCIVPFMNFTSFPDALGKMFFFLLIFGITGSLYGFIAKKMLKKDNAPFLPIITLSYIIFLIRYIIL